MACLALVSRNTAQRERANGLAWLAKLQRPDGGVPISEMISEPCWPTGLAVLAWLSADVSRKTDEYKCVQSGGAWLLTVRGRRQPDNRGVFGHDTSLQGWPWVQGTHSWVEPTAYATTALRVMGRADHPHAREGVRLLLDRTIPGGGWNYGNTRVLGNTLRPFPATTGIALAALAGEPPEDRIDSSITYLERALEQIRSPQSLAWGLIGLTAWDARPAHADRWLTESATRAARREPNVLEDALLLMADAQWIPPFEVEKLNVHG